MRIAPRSCASYIVAADGRIYAVAPSLPSPVNVLAHWLLLSCIWMASGLDPMYMIEDNKY